MESYFRYDVVIIGAGHAGIEAALACARLGAKTAVFTINLDSVGNCPCSPSIGGTAKGTLVRELDALGGEMAKTTDECFLHSKILNSGKGAAARSLRAQIDRVRYKEIMKYKIESQPNLDLKQSEIIDLKQTEKGYWLVKTRFETNYIAKCVVIACGTYLNGKVHIGSISYSSGPDGIFSSNFLGSALQSLGIRTKRFKTGTPARILKSSIDFSVLETDSGDPIVTPFSYSTEYIGQNKAVCYVAWTNSETKRIVLKNINKSAMHSGKIQGIGPRYCPSIEDKVVRFSEKEKHQIFVEPCGINTNEMYLYGMSSSLPEDVQIELYRSIHGFKNSMVMRPAYAIEYDIADPLQLNATLEFKNLKNLFSAGQLNGSSGYEEAASQGIIAGINAARKSQNKEPIILERESSYIGTMIDDLITKGVQDPYRMLTSRAEYRLILRLDNADERLMPTGYKIGLLSDESWNKFQIRIEKKEKEIKKIKNTFIKPSKNVNDILGLFDSSPLTQSTSVYELLKRPELDFEKLNSFYNFASNLSIETKRHIETEIKYEGYIKLQNHQIEKMKKLEKKLIPQGMDYNLVTNLSLESKEKLKKAKPENIGAASRISGVTPADISVLLIWIERNKV
ncbi:MAG: tRNA uridine-5-carboxymethylaminomethyl(34) synthesis enzyme MnmG [Oscillospiraceae bacterium]|jgi:tRNA uridine 5-carboxymethylaminomethyl modification enzyme|nr:tRNA uridine-5-carboxymethylaminomethyl(34) synthesis enzyme MnmG [Oscillospiraceae bacterium]